MKNMFKMLKNMFFKFESKKMSKFMTANQLFNKKTLKNMFFMFFYVFYNISCVNYVEKHEKHVFQSKNMFFSLWQ